MIITAKGVVMIQLFTTGGTIAKMYDELSGNLIFDENHLEMMLDQSRCSVDLAIKPLFLKDSLDMNDSDRDIIFKAVTNSKHKKIIITHGTDTMVQTAELLSTINDKTIVLVGAMIPFAFKNSDALFNLGTAFGVVGSVGNGVFIAMNGKFFRWDEVTKDTKLGKFVTIS